jgi:hypothetical protein
VEGLEGGPMTERTCQCLCCGPRCRAAHRDRVCPRCRDTTDEQLAALPGLYAALADHLEPGTGRGERVSGSRTPPLPVALVALTLRATGGIVATLTDIEDSWRQLLGWTNRVFRGSHEQTLDHTVKFLRNNLHWACDHHPEPQIFADAIRGLHATCKAALGEHILRVTIGHCPTATDDGPCGARLSVDPWAAQVRCPACRTEWPREHWLLLGAAMNQEAG